MPNNKIYSVREMILDRYLSSGTYYSGKELIAFCNRELERRGMELVKSRTTLQNDLTEIENKYRVVIERKQQGRQTLYRYRDANFSIYSTELSDEEFRQLRSFMDILSRFEGLPQFGWIDELAAHFNQSFTHSQSAIVGFERNKYSKGMEHFKPLFDAISQRHVLRLTYQKFTANTSKEILVHPYHLKQYNNRWFLFCLDDAHGYISNYPLDRILKIERSTKEYKVTDIDFDEYFEDIIGVSKPYGYDAVKIELWVSNSLWPYIETKPLHGSQRFLHQDETGTIIEIEVIPNYELEQLLLSFGEKVKVLSPADIKEKIASRIRRSCENY